MWLIILLVEAIILGCGLCVCIQGCRNTDKKREKRRDRRKKKIEDSGSDDEVDDGVVGFCFLDGFWGD